MNQNRLSMKTIILLMPLLLLSSCVGISKTEIQKLQAVNTAVCKTSYQEVYRCFLDHFPNDEITVKDVFSDPKMAELYIGAMQLGDQRYYYRIAFYAESSITKASLQLAPSPHGRISPEDIWQVVKSCGCQ